MFIYCHDTQKGFLSYLFLLIFLDRESIPYPPVYFHTQLGCTFPIAMGLLDFSAESVYNSNHITTLTILLYKEVLWYA